ncbi:hypothetical protein C2W62_04920 [Candidatus Entotheonella serta]|nr:hypothetical protein C2W62_04920 [Candidatus Entotheonella serta]
MGPLTRSVEDAALTYQAMRGPDVADTSTHGAGPQDVMTGLKDGVRGLRLAFAESVFWDGVDPEVERAVRACGDVFANLGAHVDSLMFPEAEASQAASPNGNINAAEAYLRHLELIGDRFEEYDPVVTYRINVGRETKAIDSRNTRVGNILRLCGLTVPCGFTEKGLPIGLMIYGKAFDEAMVLRVGYAFEQSTDWHQRRPDLTWAGDI